MSNDDIDEIIDTKTDKKEVEDHDDIFVKQLCEGLETYRKKRFSTFLSSFMAGLEIGVSFLLVAIVYSLFQDMLPAKYIPYVAAIVYPLGFILVVLGKSVLFTEQTSLLSIPVLSGKKTVRELLYLWGIVIAGNLVGGYIIGGFLVWLGPKLGIITIKGITDLADHVNHYSRDIIFASAILAGWLMALLSWIISSTHAMTSKILVIYIITFTIAVAGLHHSIVGSIEVFAGFIVSSKVTFIDYLTFQSTALLGNAIGGVVFVALLKYGTFLANNSKS